jgi:hypothetical protein
LKEWSEKSVNQPASTWNAEQWDLNRAFIATVREQISELNRLAEKARDPFLAALMRAQAMYAEAFILRLPNYQSSDRPLWQAAYDFSGAVRAACVTGALLSRCSTRQHRPGVPGIAVSDRRRHRLLLAANAAAGPAT